MKRIVLAFALFVLPALARERAVLIYPREHALFRPVFYTWHQRVLMRGLRTEYDVDVHEQVATADELFAIDVRGASLLMISGHGGPFSISLDGRDERSLDFSRREQLAAFFATLAPDATIILQSCDTGRGFAWIVKEAAGPNRRVIAAKGTVPPDGLHIESLEPFDVRMMCREGAREWDCTIKL